MGRAVGQGLDLGHSLDSSHFGGPRVGVSGVAAVGSVPAWIRRCGCWWVEWDALSVLELRARRADCCWWWCWSRCVAVSTVIHCLALWASGCWRRRGGCRLTVPMVVHCHASWASGFRCWRYRVTVPTIIRSVAGRAWCWGNGVAVSTIVQRLAVRAGGHWRRCWAVAKPAVIHCLAGRASRARSWRYGMACPTGNIAGLPRRAGCRNTALRKIEGLAGFTRHEDTARNGMHGLVRPTRGARRCRRRR